jgi:hypothetical protein
MSADLILRLGSLAADPLGNVQTRYVNTTNTPISSLTWLDNGAAIADTYTLAFTKTGAVVTVTIDCNVKNPYRDMVGKTVTCDGVTVNTLPIPGVGLVLAAGTDTGWAAKVTVSQSMAASGIVTPVLGFGVVEAGLATTGVQLACCNVGDAPAQNCKLYSLPGGYFYGTGFDTLIKKIGPHTNPARHKLAVTATKLITFANWGTDSGSGKKKADILVGGVTAVVGALFDGSTVYQYGSANGYVDGADGFLGQFITLADTTADPTAASLTMKITSDAYTWTQFAPDVSGSPGPFANQDLDLTQSGQPTGTIAAGSYAKFWARKSVPDSALAGDMRKGVIRTRGLTT